ncbi:uncharacterized protein [Haliotis cracherodii]|uniref:uncharacterized protein n=1 Tax=Haliotis cracherodii TaxID=6455 RepID=UPI0039EAE9A1
MSLRWNLPCTRLVLVLTMIVATVLTVVYFKGSKFVPRTELSSVNNLHIKLGDIQNIISELSWDIKERENETHPPVEVRTKPSPQAQPFKKKIPWQGIAYRRTNGSWVADDSVCTEDEEFDVATLKTPAGNTPICIHDVVEDRSVSKSLKAVGNWEPEVMYTAFEALNENKDHVFVDIGGNIGTFSLAAAKLGHRVISVEPYAMNTKRLCRGVVKGGFAGQMFVIYNAMSYVRETISFKVFPKEAAMTRIVKAANTKPSSDAVTTIQMNDLLEMFDIKSAVLKMDCEDHEVQVMKGAEMFFKVVDVRMVIIEWDKLYKNPETPCIIEMMERFKFKPYTIGKDAKPLNISEYNQWNIRNIVFKREE